jgi:PAS domain S-box-containing protein
MAHRMQAPESPLVREVEELRAKLAKAQELIRAIQSGEVDAFVVASPQGDQIFTLKGAEQAYRILVETMNEGAATLAADGTVLYCNQRLADAAGVPQPQIIGNPISNLIPPSEESTFGALFTRALGGQALRAELELQGSGDRRVPAYVSLRRIEGGEPAVVCMVVTDLTERKLHDELIAAGTLARSILESTSEAIAVCDDSGHIIAANEAMARLCGTNPLFQAFDAALPLEIASTNSTAERFSILSVLQGNDLRARDVILRHGDGPRLWLQLTAGRMSGPSGITGCVVTMTDITERRLSEEALLRSEKLASVGRMAAAIAHEINNPLAAATNTLFIAKGIPDLPESARQYLEMADGELKRVAFMTRQALGFYRESNAPAPMQVHAVLESAVELMKSRITAKRAVIEKQWDEDVELIAVAGELRQVFSNLLANSLDAIEENGRIKIRFSTGKDFRHGGRYARVTVTDNGKGILPSLHSNVFEPFFTTKGSVGTGLGLWICKQIIDKHNGTIRMRSSTNGGRRGTTFSIILPINAMAAADSQSTAIK